jgi:hypothetical protein
MYGFGFGYGRFLTDHLELGAMFDFTISSTHVWDSSRLGLAPFVRAYFMTGERFGLFFGAKVGYEYLDFISDSRYHDRLTVGGNCGAEWFLADSWSLRIGPSYQYSYTNWGYSGRSISMGSFGIDWAIAGYF